MANRSDFTSILPRRIKRFLALQSTGDAHHDGEMRRLFIEAHKIHQGAQKKMLSAKTNVDVGNDDLAPEATPVV